jgi:hypothetical protein
MWFLKQICIHSGVQYLLQCSCLYLKFILYDHFVKDNMLINNDMMVICYERLLYTFKVHVLLITLFIVNFRDRQRNTGNISCGVCMEDYQTTINCILYNKNNQSSCMMSLVLLYFDHLSYLIKWWIHLNCWLC